MPTYLTLNDNGLVTGYSTLKSEVDNDNLLLVDDEETAQSFLGMQRDGDTFTQVPETQPSVLTKVQFLDLFTLDELVTIEESTDGRVRVVKKYFDAADTIDLDSDRAAQMLGLLVLADVLTIERSTEIILNG